MPARASSVRRATRLRSFGSTLRRQLRVELGVQGLGAALGDLALHLIADLARDRRAQVEIRQGRPQVEAGAADDDRAAALGEQGVDLAVGGLRVAAGAGLLPGLDERQQPVLEALPLRRGRRAAQRLQAPIDLDRVAVDGNRVLASLSQALRDLDGDARLADRRRPEEGEDPQAARLSSRSCAAERRRGRARDLDLDQLAGGRGAVEVDGLVVTGAAAQPRGIGAARALDQDLHGAADEALGALPGAALDQLHQALHALSLHRVRKLVVEPRRLGAPPRREDEGEGAVVADLVDHLERPREVGLGLSGEADDDVGRDRAVRDVLADQRDPVHVALAAVGPAHPLQHGRGARLQRQVDVLAERRRAPRAPGSRPPCMSLGCGLV